MSKTIKKTLDVPYTQWLSSPSPGEEVVISGMSGRFPDSHNVEELQENLLNKKQMVTENGRRWNINRFDLPPRGGKIPNIDKFDVGYFGVHPRQANNMDPAIRVFMETATEAIMDAGVNPSELEGGKTGVFIGACWSDIENPTFVNIKEPQKFAITGYIRSMFAHRVSYNLKLKGPSVIIDAACSSSLNALYYALDSLRRGQCDNAIVGSCHLDLNPGVTIQFFRMGVLSPDGICKVFDQAANGYVRTEAANCLFLQKAKNSRRIYAQVVNCKINHNGELEEGLMFPSWQAQSKLMVELYEESNIDPSQLCYLEAHGTGTAAGDPQEIKAVDHALAKKRKEPLFVGSVKSSTGHPEPASGINAIIKVLLAMETGLISPTLKPKNIKKEIEALVEGRMKVVTEVTKIQEDDVVMGVNCSGFGGNNCHVILKRLNKSKISNGLCPDDMPRLVCVSGRTKAAVAKLLKDICKKGMDDDFISLLHQIYKTNIQNHLYRGYTIISNHGKTATCTQILPETRPDLHVFFGSLVNGFKLLASFIRKLSGFDTIIARINKILVHKTTKTLDEIAESRNGKSDNLLGAMVIQLAIADILKSLEIRPHSISGDKYGKIVTAYYNNSIQLEDAISAAIEFSQFNNNNEIHCDILKALDFADSLEKEQLNGDCTNKLRNTILLNFSDLPSESTSSISLTVIQDGSVNLLNIFGRLYLEGYVPQVQKLYPEPKFPVPRGTAMISPLLSWHHENSCFTYQYNEFTSSDADQSEFRVNLTYDEFKFITGHVIDGRNLIPATEYLRLVWQTLAQTRKLSLEDINVVFENCKFIKAVTMPSSGFIKLIVIIQKGSGSFEVLEKDSIVVCGRVRICENVKQELTNLHISPYSDDSLETIMQDEIYRELYLRGYNYSGMFKAIQKCNVDATSGSIMWENNWSSFMDNMLQMKILGIDSRQLCVPVGIKKLVINPTTHLGIVENNDKQNCHFPVHIYKECDLIVSGGIEIQGLKAKSILKKKSRLTPILEKYQFVPNCSSLDLADVVRVNTQIILENSLETHFKAVELIDDFTDYESEHMLGLVCRTLEDVPVVISDLTISSKTPVNEIPGVKVESVILTPDSNFLLIVGSKLLQRPHTLKQTLVSLSKDGFILTREPLHSKPTTIHEVEILTQYTTSSEAIFLLKKKAEIPVSKCIKVSSTDFSWLTKLQTFLSCKSNVILHSSNEKPEGLLGLVNCIRREPSGKQVKCFFMMDKTAEFDPQNVFYKEQLNRNLAVNVYKNGVWGTYRHLPLEELLKVDCDYSFANVQSRGDISSFEWLERNTICQTPFEEGKVLVSTFYAAVNFKDIMIASGRINPADFSTNRFSHEYSLGCEFAGKDLSGRRITGMIMNQGTSSHYVIDPFMSWEIPNSWTLEDAATVPVVYSTVIYALMIMKKLKPYSSILIHSATGGIGLAALNVCLYHKCDIYVTVGTEEKKEYLRKHYPQIPNSHIGNSRDTSFEAMIKRETKNRGVDIVLNSLTDDKLLASIRCLARRGRFIEIGKYDSINDTKMDLLLMEKEASFHGVHLDEICDTSIDRKNEIHRMFHDGIKNGFIKPLPRVVFNVDQVEESYRYMMLGKHIGKILIKVRDEDTKTVENHKLPFKANPRFNCDARCSYVIVGGLGGVGLELADWLALRGARKLVLVSRSGLQNGYQKQRIEIWKSHCVEVEISTEDITTYQGCENLIKEANRLGPVDAIFNLAVVLKDALFEDQSEESFQASLEPKAAATKHLDRVTKQLCPNLRYFVIFSSVSCGRGNAGQTNYGMANSIMERICEKRRDEGLPAVAIQWGAIGDVAKMQKEQKELVIGGTLQQKISSCLEVLDKLLKQEHPVVSSMVVAEKHHQNVITPTDAIIQILGVKDLKSISQHATLAELGVDSMMTTEIIQVLERDFDICLTSKDVRTLTIAKLKEMETDWKKVDEDKEVNKERQTANLAIQCLPDFETSHLLLIKLNTKVESEDAPIVFVLPGVEGSFKPLVNLTSKMNVRAIGIQYGYEHPERIQELAKNIALNIESYLSTGIQHVFVCYSFGTVVALELLNLLEAKGYNSTIILIDGSPTYSSFYVKKHFRHEEEDTFQTDVVMKLFSFVIPWKTLLEHDKTFMKFNSIEQKVEFGLTLVPAEVANDRRIEKQAIVAMYKRLKSIVNYKFTNQKIKSPVYLFKAKCSTADDKEDNDYQLSKICEDMVQVTTIDGDHASILNNSELSEAINKIIFLKFGQ